MHRALAIIGAVWSALVLLLALTVSGIFPIYSGSFYWFTLPFMVQAGASLVSAAVFIISEKRVFGLCTALLQLALPATWLFAMLRWPGGDDGPGMAWFILVGGSAVIVAAAGLPMLLINLGKKIA